jgi:hypothetical protein
MTRNNEGSSTFVVGDTTSGKGPRLSSYLNGGSSKKVSAAVAAAANDSTSVTSTSSHQPEMLSVFQKKKKPVETLPTTVASSTTAEATATTISISAGEKQKKTSSTSSKPRLDPWEWHEKLVSNESKRSTLMEQRYQSKQIQYTAMQQLVSDAIQETSLAYRWTTSISKIQDQFAQSLTLQETMNPAEHDYTSSTDKSSSTNGPIDLDDPEALYNQMVESVTLNDTLPEKVKTIPPEGEEATENSLAGSFNIDDERNAIHEVAVIVTTTAPTKKNSMLELISSSAKNIGTTINTTNISSPAKITAPGRIASNDTATLKHQPPVFAISFPNPYCSNDAYYILHKQHELLQQTFSRNGVNQISIDKMHQMKELCAENENKLQELAGTILQDWKTKESEIQKLWNNYLSVNQEVLSTIPTTTPMPEWPKATDVETKMKCTTGDVWLAEILYRTAVKRQEINFVQEELTLQSLFEMVKEGERQRRLRLRKHVQTDVLQKHASIFERVQLAHAEAIDEYISPTTTFIDYTNNDNHEYPDEYKYLENDTFEMDDLNDHETKDKKGKKKTTKKQVIEKTKLSIKEQIQNIALFIGTTTVWDTPNGTVSNADSNKANKVDDTVSSSQQEQQHDEQPKSVDVAEIGGVDVDMYVGSFDDDDDDEEEYTDLPLLKDAVIDPISVTGSSPSTKRKKSKRRVKRKSATTKDTSVQVQNDDNAKFKINNAVVLDHESTKHAYFMDQLLYSGSLLESHYVQYAAVVGLEDNYPAYSYVDGSESKSATSEDTKKCALVIITSDDIFHLLEIPIPATSISSGNSYVKMAHSSANGRRDEVAVVPGSRPDDALSTLLLENTTIDLIMKEQQDIQALLKEKYLPPPPSPSKLSSFLRTKSITKEEESKCFQFNNLTPSLSMPLSECVVRQSLNGQTSVRISHNAQNPRVASNKLVFASAAEQHAFLTATRTEVTLWDLK